MKSRKKMSDGLELFEMKLTSDLAFTTESAEQKVFTPSEVMGIVSTAPLNTPEISKCLQNLLQKRLFTFY